ncbi:ATP-dependent nuclease [Streptomyces sp. NPDC088785]|uniref:ATP-dependent nuclease n=1 Tax=Streptomyces sp. NPDC088785 TaxID=3365897 RepID=UPI00382BBFA8
MSSIEFEERAPFAGQRASLEPFTIITGMHGAGKSTLLNSLTNSLRGTITYSDQPPFFGKPKFGLPRPALDGLIRINIKTQDGESLSLQATVKDGRNVDVNIPSPLVPNYQNTYITSSDIFIFFQDFMGASMEEYLTGEPEVQNRKDLDALRSILGVDYDEVTYYPLEVGSYGPTFPYVKARKGSTWIDSFAMSYGELTVHKFRWEIKHAEPDEVFLLDEPEAHVAPRGRAALVDELARMARTSNVQVVIATHSAEFINRVPLHLVRMCVNLGDSRTVMTPSSAADLRNTLGVEPPLRSFIVVEDEVAEAVLTLLLTRQRFSRLSEMEIIKAGSWSDVITTCTTLASSRRTRTVGVLDGDQRKQLLKNRECSLLCLPGNQAPERVFIEYASRNIEKMALRLGCSMESMAVCISEMRGADHHSWLDTLSRRTGHDWQYCLRVAFEAWYEEPVNAATAAELASRIEEFLL